MADNEQQNSVKIKNSESGATGKVVSRRRFTKTGVSGAAVVMSLLNRPAFGNAAQCTPSILASYNLSAHPDIVECKFGCSPEFWQLSNPNSSCSWDMEISASYGRGMIFSTAFNLSDTLRDTADPFSEALYTQTLQYFVNDGLANQGLASSFNQVALHAVAALLNSLHPLVSTAYPFTMDEVLMDFFTAYSNYFTSNTVAASRDISLLENFVTKYDIYVQENLVCVLPTDNCSNGNVP